MKTFIFKIVRAPYSVPLVLKRNASDWEEVLKEFPDAIYINEYLK